MKMMIPVSRSAVLRLSQRLSHVHLPTRPALSSSRLRAVTPVRSAARWHSGSESTAPSAGGCQWTPLIPHIAYCTITTSATLYRCTHTSPALVVLPSPTLPLPASLSHGHGSVVTICTLDTHPPTSPPLPALHSGTQYLTRIPLDESNTTATLVHVPSASLAILPTLLYWPLTPGRDAPGDMIPLASRADLRTLATVLDKLAPRVLVSHLHPAPLILHEGSLAALVTSVFANMHARVADQLQRRPAGVTAAQVARALLESRRDLGVSLPEARVASAVESVLGEMEHEGNVARHARAPPAAGGYQFQAAHGSLGRPKNSVDLNGLSPEQIRGPGGLTMAQIMAKVQQAHGVDKPRQAARGHEDKVGDVSEAKWVWVR